MEVIKELTGDLRNENVDKVILNAPAKQINLIIVHTLTNNFDQLLGEVREITSCHIRQYFFVANN